MMVNQIVKIRTGDTRDIPFLKEMLFEAAFWRQDQVRPSLEAGLTRSDLVYLLEDWGREGDTAIIALTQEGHRVGAAWYRFWESQKHSYGYVSPEIPELAIAVREAYRGLGIGHLLIEELLNTAAINGVGKVSLSVEVDNPAMNLYLDHGFELVEKVGNSWTMIAKTK